MASKAGKIDEFFDFDALNKEIKKVSDTLAKGYYAELPKLAVSTAAAGSAVKGASGINEQKTAQEQLNKVNDEAAKIIQKIAQAEMDEVKKLAELKIQLQQKTQATKEAVMLDEKIVGAYKAQSTLLQKRIKDYKDLAMAGKANTAAAKEELKGIQELDKNIKKLDASLGQHQRNVGNYPGAMKAFGQAVREGSTQMNAFGGVFDKVKSIFSKFSGEGAGIGSKIIGGAIAGFVGLGAAIGVGIAAFKGISATIDKVASSTGDLKDRWEEMTTGMKFGWDQVVRSLATGDFTNFVTRMKEAIKLGQEYAKTLDKLEDRTISLSMRESEITNEIDKERLALKNVNLTSTERQAHVDKLIKLEQGLTAEKKVNAEELYKTEMKTAMFETKSSAFVIETYLKQATAFEPLVDKAKEYNDLKKELAALNKLDAQISPVAVEGEKPVAMFTEQDRARKAEIELQLLNTEANVKSFASVVEKMGNLSDVTRDKLVAAFVAANNVTHEYNQSVEKALTTANKLDAKSDKTGQSEAEEKAAREKKMFDELIKQSDELGKNYADTIKYQEELDKKTNELRLKYGADTADELLRIEMENVTKSAEFAQLTAQEQVRVIAVLYKTALAGISGKAAPMPAGTEEESVQVETGTLGTPANVPLPDYTDEDLSKDAAAWNQKVQVAADAISKIDALVNMSYQNRFAQIDAEAARDQQAKEGELKAAGNNTGKIQAINDKYDQREKEREKEKRRLQKEAAAYAKKSAIINAIINTALAVTAQLTLPVVGWVMAALALAAGIAEVALISSQPTPSYAKGRKGGKAEIANVGEQGTEAIVTKSGEISLTPSSTTTTFLPEGASVIPHHELLEMAGRATSFMPTYSNQTYAMSELRDEIRGLHAGFRMLNNTVKNKRENYLNITERGLQKIYKDGETWTEYINTRVKI